ncbi:MAG: cadherin-like domain-containing protein, partial [Snowella sp.]|nr:cadherin-like domain-containing protein [Snowella sp.]
QNLGSNIASAQTAVAQKVTTVYIKQGDSFTVKGTENGDEHARLDYIDFLPTTPSANTPPVAVGDSASTLQNQALTLLAANLLANDTDADGDKLALSSVKNAINGSVVLNANGNPVFTPTTNFTGNASFDYVISDGRGGAATATVKVLVNSSTTPTQTLPDLGTKFAPVSNPTLKTGSDIFSPSFLVADSGGSSRPAIAEWTRSGKGGDTIILTGWQFDSSTKFYLYGQTTATNGALLEAKIQKLDGNMAAITLPSGLPQGSNYLLWAKNSSGYSQPVMINQTESWWVQSAASRGQTTSIFGRNLSQDGGTLSSQVYLEDSAGKGYWAQVTAVNPYKVDFKIPDTLANGTYKVYVHNGDGGQYGWSKPLTMTVNNGINYTGTVFNVKNYGAKGDGVSNDTAAIKAALAAADQTPWSTVYLPAGTYVINETLWTGRDQVRWLGDGKDTTTIKAANGSSQNYIFQSDGVNQITFQNLTLNTNSANAKNIQFGLLARNSSDLQFFSIKINAEGTNPFDWHAGNRISMKNSDVIGQNSFLGSANQVFIDSSKFYGTGYTDAIISAFGAQNLSITNSTAQNLDTSSPTNGKWAKGRFFVDFAAWSIAQNQYFGNNQTIDLAPPAAAGVDANSGEQIMWEPPWLTTASLGSATSATANTVRVSIPSSKVNDSYMISIIGGKGIGQSRRVKSFDSATGTYTLYDPWNVQPDQSSLMVGNRQVNNAVVYSNSLDGLSDYKTRYTASAGVQPYFGSSNLIIDSNNFNQLRTGVNLWAGSEVADRNPINFTQVMNNTFTDNLTGISMRSSGKLGTTIFGNSVQNNKFTNIGTVFAMNQGNDGSGNPYPSANMNVFERNTLGSGIGKAINFNQGNGYFANDIFLNNTWSQANINLGVTNGNLSI